MDADLCQLCLESCTEMKYNFLHSIENTNVQEFVEAFCQFVFQDSTCTFDIICAKCDKTLQQFSQYCEKIRSIHYELMDEPAVNQTLNFVGNQAEMLLENIEEYDGVELECQDTIELLVDVSDDGGDTSNRRTTLEITPRVIANLEEQLKFEASTVNLDDTEFSRFAHFIPMKCNACALELDSFEEYNDHFLCIHQRSAVWNCCNLILETPYDALDHLKYHEGIDSFKCAACHKCFLTSNKLKYHIRRTHLPAEGSLSCEICNKECRNLRLLLNHQRSHIHINCPHCKKHITASNYEQHVRTIHASIQGVKRKTTSKIDGAASKKKAAEKLTLPSGSKKTNPKSNASCPPQKNSPARPFAVNSEPNENGMFECDVCRMEFKQISLVYSHRNKVHV